MIIDQLQHLSRWFKERRWYGFKDEAKIKINLEWHKLLNDICLTVIKVIGSKRQQLYYIPFLLNDKYGHSINVNYCVKPDNDFLCEAEFYPSYYNNIFVSPKISNSDCLQISLYENLEPASMVEHIRGSTNPVVKIICNDKTNYILKTYRKVYKQNREYVFLKKLQNKISFIPSILAELSHSTFGVFTIILKFFDSLGDGGYPFYQNLISYLKGESDIASSLAKKLGKITACLHKTLIDYENPFFKPEKITIQDISYWKQKILRYIRYSGISQEYFYRIIDNLQNYINLFKIQIHQDYHLSQLLYTVDKNFVVLDFEGEPGRKEYELFLKEPAFRDLGCMVRSFDYLSYFALSHYLNLDLQKTLSHYRTVHEILVWRQVIIEEFMKSYFKNMLNAKEKVIGSDIRFDDAVILTLPWILEKTLYEYLYEKKYRPRLMIIPKHGLYEIASMRHPFFSLLS